MRCCMVYGHHVAPPTHVTALMHALQATGTDVGFS